MLEYSQAAQEQAVRQEQVLRQKQREMLEKVLALTIQDKAEFDRLQRKGCNNARVSTLGVVGAVNQEGSLIVPGLRTLATIAQTYETSSMLEECGLGRAIPQFFYPVNANAYANSSPAELNLQYAEAHFAMADRLREVLFPDVEQPEALVDKGAGLALLVEKADEIAPDLSPETLEKLLEMARKHTLDTSQTDEQMLRRSIVYFLSHFSGYRKIDIPDYLDIQGHRVFKVPRSEKKFMAALETESAAVLKHFPQVPVKKEDRPIEVRAVSKRIHRPPYYLYRDEQSLATIDQSTDIAAHVMMDAAYNHASREEKEHVSTYLGTILGDRNNDVTDYVIHPYVKDLQALAQEYHVPICV